ncbi:hypothetical protein PVAG01_08729 [Phlyctema vagabunda]|uniref:Zn(2)-C6 fungal-type domain-containing protein n=1 Tax=Phlyctema vagabunda TaxID=108571 RepID=A0ABR4PAB4_9HELO
MESMKGIFSVAENDEPTPRRKHKKSRAGCQTCKRRHVKCDEFYPVCRTCSRLGLPCEYLNAGERTPQLGENSQSQNSQNSQLEIETMNVIPQPFQEYQTSPVDQRLVNHLFHLATNLRNNGISELSLSARELPLFLELGRSHSSTREALLAISATHLGILTRSAGFDNLALAHQTAAYGSLQESINNFSQENADATLATSIVLAFQAPDWRAWSRLVNGNIPLIKAMQPWISQSIFYEYSLETLRQCEMDHASIRSPVDLIQFQKFGECLNQAIPFMGDTIELSQLHRDLAVFTQNLRDFPPDSSAADQFNISFQLRSCLFWMPNSYLESRNHDINIVVAYVMFHGMAWCVRDFFPAVPDIIFRKTRLRDMERALAGLLSIRSRQKEEDERLVMAVSLLESLLEVMQGLKVGERLQ